jgi:hypothetical protein
MSLQFSDQALTLLLPSRQISFASCNFFLCHCLTRCLSFLAHCHRQPPASQTPPYWPNSKGLLIMPPIKSSLSLAPSVRSKRLVHILLDSNFSFLFIWVLLSVPGKCGTTVVLKFCQHGASILELLFFH